MIILTEYGHARTMFRTVISL